MLAVALVTPFALLGLLIGMGRIERSLHRAIGRERILEVVVLADADEAERAVVALAEPLLVEQRFPAGPARDPRPDPGRLVGMAAALLVFVGFATADAAIHHGTLGGLTDVGVIAGSVSFGILVRPRRLATTCLPLASLSVVAAAASLWQGGTAHASFRLWRASFGDDLSDAIAPLIAATAAVALAVALRRWLSRLPEGVGGRIEGQGSA